MTLSSSGGKVGSGTWLQVVLQGFALVGQDQAGLIQRVAPEHAAHRVADEFLHRVGQQQASSSSSIFRCRHSGNVDCRSG